MDQSLVLVGGGHSHAIALHGWAMQGPPSCHLTLISDVSHAPYSGMMPGHVAGRYDRQACFIDLQRLCDRVGAQLQIDRAVGLDLPARQVQLAGGGAVSFDWLSVNTGSTPDVSPEVRPLLGRSVMAAKPIQAFLAGWDRLLADVTADRLPAVKLVIVGGGAGGVELALAAQWRLFPRLGDRLSVAVVQRDRVLLPQFDRRVGDRLRRVLDERQIRLHLGETVVNATIIDQKIGLTRLSCASGLEIDCDRAIWATQATAPAWLAASGLATDAQGFITVDDRLQSTSHPYIFAAGDVATMVNHPRPKSGVFAVRQGLPLARNLKAAIEGRALQSFYPQKRWLSLINLADDRAIAVRGSFVFSGRWAWRWKDRIDRQFMQKLQ